MLNSRSDTIQSSHNGIIAESHRIEASSDDTHVPKSAVFQVESWLNKLAMHNMKWHTPADAAAGKKLLSDEILCSMKEFMERFREEEACRQALFYLRWPGGFVCPCCAEHDYYYIQTRKLYECTNCSNQVSVTAHTFFHGTKLPLAYWFFTIYWVAVDRHCTANRLAAVLQVQYRTALRMLHVIRAAMRMSNGRHMLSSIVEEEEGRHNHSSSEQEGEKEQRDVLLQRCRSLLVSKAKAYIRAAYRRVSERHRQRYVDEFMYQWLRRFNMNPIDLGKGLLQACGTLVYREDIEMLIRPVFPRQLTPIKSSDAAHPDQVA